MAPGRAADGADPDAGEDLAELASALERERGVQEVRAARALEALDRARDLHADVTRRGAAQLPCAQPGVDAAAARGVAGAAEAQSVLAAAATREAIDAAADALMPDGWVLDAATGDAVPGRRPAAAGPRGRAVARRRRRELRQPRQHRRARVGPARRVDGDGAAHGRRRGGGGGRRRARGGGGGAHGEYHLARAARGGVAGGGEVLAR